MKRVLFFLLIIGGIVFSGCCGHQKQKQTFNRQSALSFQNLSEMFISHMEVYYRQNGRYASKVGKSRFEDIGLDPLKWQDKMIDGIIYDPRGNRLHVRPAKGYTIFAKDVKGVTRIISYILGWDLIYDLDRKEWYLHRIDPDQCMDISTFRIKKDTPYNPEEYKKYKSFNK